MYQVSKFVHGQCEPKHISMFIVVLDVVPVGLPNNVALELLLV